MYNRSFSNLFVIFAQSKQDKPQNMRCNFPKTWMLAMGLCLTSVQAMAQAITYNFDTKVIMADSLTMPESTVAKHIVSMLPELLERPGVYTLNDYQVKVEDMPVGSAVDAVLTQIRLCDIEKIEVSESPIATYQNNSKSGSINIILRKRATPEKPYWGSASLDASMPLDLWPKLSLGYQKGKVMARTLLLGDLYRATYDTDTRTYDASENLLSESTTSDAERFWSNLEILFLNYNPTERDQLMMNVAHVQTSVKDELTETANHTAVTAEEKGRAHNLNVFMKYVHQFAPAAKLECIAQYQHNPGKSDDTYPNGFTHKDKQANEVFAQVSGTIQLLPADSKYRSQLVVGAKGNLSLADTDADHQHTMLALTHSYCDQVRSRGCTPFVESENRLGQFRLKLSANLPYYHYDFRRKGSERMEKDNTDCTVKMIAAYDVTRNHTVRLIADRQSSRPAETNLYPHLMEDVTNTQYTLGNLGLKNLHSEEYTLEYFFNKKWGGHTLHVTLGGSYNHISNVVGSEQGTSADNTSYTTFRNVGHNHQFIGEFMARYTYKMVSVTLTSDYYNNQVRLNTGNDHYRYCNLVLMPTFKTKSNIMGSMRVKYCSPVNAAALHRGGCAAVSMQLGKSWGNLNVHAYGNWALSGRTTDITYLGQGGRVETTDDAFKNVIGAGVRYGF